MESEEHFDVQDGERRKVPQRHLYDWGKKVFVPYLEAEERLCLEGVAPLLHRDKEHRRVALPGVRGA